MQLNENNVFTTTLALYYTTFTTSSSSSFNHLLTYLLHTYIDTLSPHAFLYHPYMCITIVKYFYFCLVFATKTPKLKY